MRAIWIVSAAPSRFRRPTQRFVTLREGLLAATDALQPAFAGAGGLIRQCACAQYSMEKWQFLSKISEIPLAASGAEA